MSTVDPSIEPIKAVFVPDSNAAESPALNTLITSLKLLKHIEGGYFAEIDRNPLTIPNPFLPPGSCASAEVGLPTPPELGSAEREAGRTALVPRSGDDLTRNASTSIYYLLTPTTPLGSFHRNRGRTIHTLISGRGRYVLIHADEEGGKKRVETFVVGKNVEKGERPVWVVEGGKYKASFLLEGEGDGLLISETVIPGFEYSDHDFLTGERFRALVTGEQAEELAWLVRKGEPPKESELL